MRAAFESCIARSLAEEKDRVSAYYHEHIGEFWVADRRGDIIGMFGLESAGPGSCELRRMYVAPSARRAGVQRDVPTVKQQDPHICIPEPPSLVAANNHCSPGGACCWAPH
jgi:putative acetyltransferase